MYSKPQLYERKGGKSLSDKLIFRIIQIYDFLPKKILFLRPKKITVISRNCSRLTRLQLVQYLQLLLYGKDDFLPFPCFFGHLRHGDDEKSEVKNTGCRMQLASVNTVA
ncbi:hypothetical protein E2C01_009232 [Portunus trituberculatus]|uniref:Uncharacterized protein n=1 Tax=Portunus trituberculatus TaxID=210409 RepID=A0A5B7D428_PORTR|nr:hypothetical protein [Portunus trituberculatus]